MGTSFFIAKINLDDAQYCDSCPCLYMTEGMYSDCCQLDKAVRDVEQDRRGRVIRPNWCPLLKVTDER